MSENSPGTGPTRKPSTDVCKVVGFTSHAGRTEAERLLSDLEQATDRLAAEGIGVRGARAMGFDLSAFVGVELVKYRTDLLPGPVPPGAVMVWFDLEPGTTPEPKAVSSAVEPFDLHHTSVVDEYVQYTSERWGTVPAGIVRIGLISRLPALTHAEFAVHWIDRHGPLVVEHKPLYDLYVSNVLVYPEAEWDGVVEHWFTDEATWREHDRRNLEEKPEVIASARSGSQMQQFAAKPVGSVQAGA